jgi:hypothetical protein
MSERKNAQNRIEEAAKSGCLLGASESTIRESEFEYEGSIGV